MSRATYHHGDLRAVILAEAARLIAERGAEQLSLRELAREAGVSHAAPAHHFTDRRGLFTALATQGFQKLATALADSRPDFSAAALAYVQFAVENPGPFAVMFAKSLVNDQDPELVAAQIAARNELGRGVATLTDPHAAADPEGAALAAWSMVHGYAMLWLNQAVPADDPVATARRLTEMLFRG
ncbi:TetR family transcriptional regulator [Mycobacterium sp. MS1601]|uniref:TetR/AcrR family transcriptional regulator n=1 Tax=Mycobacterium sp. MS1601 TaxID=1936029 RepID=UPI0009791727|nr:TetR/AcrR family transcriptional regulator [Mycobacterium sp. MS1601]AQA06229.1 TetR family transcriptional regulator [Mycobacterium sp. MS1601]